MSQSDNDDNKPKSPGGKEGTWLFLSSKPEDLTPASSATGLLWPGGREGTLGEVGRFVLTANFSRSLTKHLNKLMRDVRRRKHWQASLGVLVTALAAFFTGNFRTWLGVKGPVWEAVFLIVLIASAVWFVGALTMLVVSLIKGTTDASSVVDTVLKESEPGQYIGL